VPLDADFFTLGGDSMMAVELFLRIEEELGRRLPRTALFECGTVAEMSVAIDSAYRAQCIVPIQPNGDRPPFFCVHGIDGDMLYFRDLARHLGNSQPFYGIRARGLDATAPPSVRIEEMADRYLDEIRRLQPRGPYYIGGYSFGGWVAFEIACRLRAAGETVALLAILDTKCANGKTLLPLLAGIGRANDVAKPTSRNGFIAGSRFKSAANHVRLNAMALGCRFGVLTRRLEERFRRYPIEAHSVALRRYRPERYDGDAILFHTAGEDASLPSQYAGWRKLINGTLETRRIGASHYDMMYEPVVRELAETLGDAIAGATAHRS
jgi:thioesterase domain-containing protein